MRELKFRMWSNSQNKYVDWTFMIVSTEGDLYSLDEINAVEQYTGLKDKNGKKIYEGDIVKRARKTPENKSTIYQVVWDNFNASFGLNNLDRGKTDIGTFNEVAMEYDYKVIGNIHENSDLLK